MTRRFLFSVAGGYGHLHPLMPLARRAPQAGHDVAFAVGAGLQPAVEAAGFALFPVGGNAATDPEYQQIKAQLATMPVNSRNRIVRLSPAFCGIGARLRTPELVEIAQSWQPDMFIREAGRVWRGDRRRAPGVAARRRSRSPPPYKA